MRLRNALLCAATAIALALAVPGSAAVADGELRRAAGAAAGHPDAPAAVLVAGPAGPRINSYEPRDNWPIG
ncbi:hypothetical protein ACWEQL_40475 [Kitasatospora sp. NPDC004240]